MFCKLLHLPYTLSLGNNKNHTHVKKVEAHFRISYCSATSRRNLGTTFSDRDLVYFLQYTQTSIDLCCFADFYPLLFSCMFFWAEQKGSHCLLKKFVRQHFTFSLIHFWGHFFGCPYHLNTATFSLDTTLYWYLLKNLKNK